MVKEKKISKIEDEVISKKDYKDLKSVTISPEKRKLFDYKDRLFVRSVHKLSFLQKDCENINHTNILTFKEVIENFGCKAIDKILKFGSAIIYDPAKNEPGCYFKEKRLMNNLSIEDFYNVFSSYLSLEDVYVHSVELIEFIEESSSSIPLDDYIKIAKILRLNTIDFSKNDDE